MAPTLSHLNTFPFSPGCCPYLPWERSDDFKQMGLSKNPAILIVFSGELV